MTETIRKTFTKAVLPPLVTLAAIAAALTSASSLTVAQDRAEDILVGWFELSDCHLTFREVVDRSLSVEGLAPIDMKDSLDRLIRAHGVRRDVNGDFVLVTGDLCAGTVVAQPEISPNSSEATLVDIMGQNGCEMSQRAIVEAALARGLEFSAIDRAADALDSQGAFVASENGLTLVIGDTCGR
ncbi:MAG: hypothetical protein EVA88_01940 [Rhodospirillaceae bacterium]|nr:MAG: hypothetical protein EVA88_01940 [Rhodospirillaceae bacterium]